MGAALIERAPLRGESAAEPGGERVAQLAGLVAGEAREGDDSLLALPQRIRACRLESRAEVPETEIAEGERVPSVAYGILLVLLAPVVLVWTRRYGWSWNGCWRWACEGACISACGLLGSLPIGALLVTHDSAAPGEPSTALSVAAGLPQGIEATRSSLESALAAEGYSASGRTTRMLGDAQGWALAVDRLAASAEPVLGHLATWAGPLGPREPALLNELAGDPGQRASAIRIEAPHVRGAHAEAWRGLLGRILERTRVQ